MKISDFCNALDNYISHDQMQSAVKLIEKATGLELSTVLTILSIVDSDRFVFPTRIFTFDHKGKRDNPTLGHLIYTELQNNHNRYCFSGSSIIHTIKMFNFKQHFENI
jgi:hypothetical protein